MDPGFHAHKALSEVTAELVLRLASQTHIPLNPLEISYALTTAYDEVHSLLTQRADHQQIYENIFGELP